MEDRARRLSRVCAASTRADLRIMSQLKNFLGISSKGKEQ